MVFSISLLYKDLVVIGYLISSCCWDPSLHCSCLAFSALFVVALPLILRGVRV